MELPLTELPPELFHEALSLGDYRGGLVFQKVKDFPVSPLEEIEKAMDRDKFLEADEAKTFGIIDEVFDKRPDPADE
mgnify:CR=1 FL=1